MTNKALERLDELAVKFSPSTAHIYVDNNKLSCEEVKTLQLLIANAIEGIVMDDKGLSRCGCGYEAEVNNITGEDTDPYYGVRCSMCRIATLCYKDKDISFSLWNAHSNNLREQLEKLDD